MCSISGFALSQAATMLILMILHDFCLLLSAKFLYLIVYIRKETATRSVGGIAAAFASTVIPGFSLSEIDD
jgi:hypothetical protein